MSAQKPSEEAPEEAAEEEGYDEAAVEDYDEAPAYDAYERADEWPFPDPNEPAPTGLLPSTAVARRRARAGQPD